MTSIRFTRGKQRATLQETMVEVWVRQGGHRPSKPVWRQRLALLLDDGSWAYTEHWQTNHHRKATRDVLELGWALETKG